MSYIQFIKKNYPHQEVKIFTELTETYSGWVIFIFADIYLVLLKNYLEKKIKRIKHKCVFKQQEQLHNATRKADEQQVWPKTVA